MTSYKTNEIALQHHEGGKAAGQAAPNVRGSLKQVTALGRTCRRGRGGPGTSLDFLHLHLGCPQRPNSTTRASIKSQAPEQGPSRPLTPGLAFKPDTLRQRCPTLPRPPSQSFLYCTAVRSPLHLAPSLPDPGQLRAQTAHLDHLSHGDPWVADTRQQLLSTR